MCGTAAIEELGWKERVWDGEPLYYKMHLCEGCKELVVGYIAESQGVYSIV